MTEYYIDYKNGSNNNSGTAVDDAFRTLAAFDAWDGSVSPSAGDTIYLRGNATIQEPAQTNLVGYNAQSGNRITITNYEDEQPVLDYGNSGGDGIRLIDSDYWTIENVAVKRASKHNVSVSANTNGPANYTTLRNVESLESAQGGRFGAGIKVADGGTGAGPKGVKVLACYVHDNTGGGGNSTGIDVTTNSQNAVIKDCISSYNGDDGYDLFDADPSNPHLLDRCVAHHNGLYRDGSKVGGDGNGFKLGGGSGSGGHTAQRCVSYGNYNAGFNTNDASESVTMLNCTAYNNGHGSTNSSEAGFRLHGSGGHVVTNSIAYQNSGGPTSQSDGDEVFSHDTWTLDLTVSDSDFQSTSPGEAGFLYLAADSALVDAGTDVGLAYSGSNPDLGAYETSNEAETTSDTGTQAISVYDGSQWVGASVNFYDGSQWVSL